MRLFFQKTKRAQSTIEYAVLAVLIMTALLVAQRFIMRGMAGNWKRAGDAMGSGREYSASHTFECAYDQWFTNRWYSIACYQARKCAADCRPLLPGKEARRDADCKRCIQRCFSPACDR